MTRAAALILALAALPAGAQAPPQFAAEVRVVRIDALATQGGRPLTGLEAAQFEVRDEGVPQAVTIESAGGPVHAVLALDVSGSVIGERLKSLQAAAHAFVDGLRPDDEATVLAFSHRIAVAAGPTHDREALHRAIDAVQPGGATVLYDAVFAAMALAAGAEGRPLVLVFSDGADHLSWLGAATVARAARESDCWVHTVAAGDFAGEALQIDASGLSNEPRGPSLMVQPRTGSSVGVSATRVRPADVPEFLQEIARETGGRAWRATDPARLREAFLGVLDEVRSRYVLRYEPQGVPGPGWHRLQVRLRGVGGDVRARRGYLSGAR